MVVGSIGAMIYGEPRLTRDLDVVLVLKPHDLETFRAAFSEAEFYLPPVVILSQEFQQHGQFNLIDLASSLKIDCMLRKPSPHGMAEFARRIRQAFLPDLQVWVAAPEDIIIKKLQFYREGRSDKHLGDIRGILVHTKVDRDYIERWTKDLGLSTFWEQVNA
jgi:hypothetical protein